MCGDYNLRREKRYVEVDVRFTPDGKIRPLAINYDKTRTYGIDRVLAVRHGTSRLGGKGHCFTCLICGQKRNLWLEQGKWFVEAYWFVVIPGGFHDDTGLSVQSFELPSQIVQALGGM